MVADRSLDARLLLLGVGLFLASGSFEAFASSPRPLVFEGLPEGEGRWRMELLSLEAPGLPVDRMPREVRVCIDASQLVHPRAQPGDNGQDHCTQEIVEDTAKRARVRTTCEKRQGLVSIERKGPRRFRVEADLTGGFPERMSLRARYTYEGPCSERQGAEGQGAEGHGSEGQGAEDHGSEGQGAEGHGSEGQGAEGHGLEDRESDGSDGAPPGNGSAP